EQAEPGTRSAGSGNKSGRLRWTTRLGGESRRHTVSERAWKATECQSIAGSSATQEESVEFARDRDARFLSENAAAGRFRQRIFLFRSASRGRRPDLPERLTGCPLRHGNYVFRISASGEVAKPHDTIVVRPVSPHGILTCNLHHSRAIAKPNGRANTIAEKCSPSKVRPGRTA